MSCVERVTLNFLLSLLWAFTKLVCACVWWTGVGQWVTVAGCGSELWAFWRVFMCVLIRQRGQPCNPMRAPTHRTNEGIVCTSRKHWPGDCVYTPLERTIKLTTILQKKYNYDRSIQMFNLISGTTQWSYHHPVCQAFMVISPNDSKLLIYWGGIISLSVQCCTFHMSANALKKIKQT